MFFIRQSKTCLLYVTNPMLLRNKVNERKMTLEEFQEETRRVRPMLTRVAQQYLRDGDEAEDTVQDVLLRLWQMLDELRPPFEPLARRLVRNFAIDKLRRKKPTMTLTDMGVVDDEPPDDLVEKTMRIVETLPEMQQVILRLRHMEGMEMREIAQLTGSTEVAVRKVLSRARKAVMKGMENKRRQDYDD